MQQKIKQINARYGLCDKCNQYKILAYALVSFHRKGELIDSPWMRSLSLDDLEHEFYCPECAVIEAI